MCSFCRLQLWNVDGGPNDVLRPKKVIQQYWEIDKRKSRPQALAKQKYALGETSGKVTSHPKDPQPRLLQLPLLFQKDRQVGHGGERVRVIRAEVRFAPCKRSAVQRLRLASWDDGVGGVGPQAWIRLWVLCDHVGKEERWTMALCLDWWKRCQIQLCHVRCTHNSKLIQSLKNKTQRSMSWHVQQNLDVSHLRSNLPVVKKSKLRKQKESSNNTGKQKESPGFKPWSNQKMPLVKRPGKSPLTPKTSTCNRPQGTRGSASEKQCQMARKRVHLQNYFVGLHWIRLATLSCWWLQKPRSSLLV